MTRAALYTYLLIRTIHEVLLCAETELQEEKIGSRKKPFAVMLTKKALKLKR